MADQRELLPPQVAMLPENRAVERMYQNQRKPLSGMQLLSSPGTEGATSKHGKIGPGAVRLRAMNEASSVRAVRRAAQEEKRTRVAALRVALRSWRRYLSARVSAAASRSLLARAGHRQLAGLFALWRTCAIAHQARANALAQATRRTDLRTFARWMRSVRWSHWQRVWLEASSQLIRQFRMHMALRYFVQVLASQRFSMRTASMQRLRHRLLTRGLLAFRTAYTLLTRRELMGRRRPHIVLTAQVFLSMHAWNRRTTLLGRERRLCANGSAHRARSWLRFWYECALRDGAREEAVVAAAVESEARADATRRRALHDWAAAVASRLRQKSGVTQHGWLLVTIEECARVHWYTSVLRYSMALLYAEAAATERMHAASVATMRLLPLHRLQRRALKCADGEEMMAAAHMHARQRHLHAAVTIWARHCWMRLGARGRFGRSSLLHCEQLEMRRSLLTWRRQHTLAVSILDQIVRRAMARRRRAQLLRWRTATAAAATAARHTLLLRSVSQRASVIFVKRRVFKHWHQAHVSIKHEQDRLQLPPPPPLPAPPPSSSSHAKVTNLSFRLDRSPSALGASVGDSFAGSAQPRPLHPTTAAPGASAPAAHPFWFARAKSCATAAPTAPTAPTPSVASAASVSISYTSTRPLEVERERERLRRAWVLRASLRRLRASSISRASRRRDARYLRHLADEHLERVTSRSRARSAFCAWKAFCTAGCMHGLAEVHAAWRQSALALLQWRAALSNRRRDHQLALAARRLAHARAATSALREWRRVCARRARLRQGRSVGGVVYVSAAVERAVRLWKQSCSPLSVSARIATLRAWTMLTPRRWLRGAKDAHLLRRSLWRWRRAPSSRRAQYPVVAREASAVLGALRRWIRRCNMRARADALQLRRQHDAVLDSVRVWAAHAKHRLLLRSSAMLGARVVWTRAFRRWSERQLGPLLDLELEAQRRLRLNRLRSAWRRLQLQHANGLSHAALCARMLAAAACFALRRLHAASESRRCRLAAVHENQRVAALRWLQTCLARLRNVARLARQWRHDGDALGNLSTHVCRRAELLRAWKRMFSETNGGEIQMCAQLAGRDERRRQTLARWQAGALAAAAVAEKGRRLKRLCCAMLVVKALGRWRHALVVANLGAERHVAATMLREQACFRRWASLGAREARAQLRSCWVRFWLRCRAVATVKRHETARLFTMTAPSAAAAACICWFRRWRRRALRKMLMAAVFAPRTRAVRIGCRQASALRFWRRLANARAARQARLALRRRKLSLARWRAQTAEQRAALSALPLAEAARRAHGRRTRALSGALTLWSVQWRAERALLLAFSRSSYTVLTMRMATAAARWALVATAQRASVAMVAAAAAAAAHHAVRCAFQQCQAHACTARTLDRFARAFGAKTQRGALLWWRSDAFRAKLIRSKRAADVGRVLLLKQGVRKWEHFCAECAQEARRLTAAIGLCQRQRIRSSVCPVNEVHGAPTRTAPSHQHLSKVTPPHVARTTDRLYRPQPWPMHACSEPERSKSRLRPSAKCVHADAEVRLARTGSRTERHCLWQPWALREQFVKCPTVEQRTR